MVIISNMLWYILLFDIVWWQCTLLSPIVIKFNFPKFWFFESLGITFAPFIFINTKNGNIDTEQYNVMLKHEKRHIFQYRIFTPLLFLALYILNYLINLCIYKFNVNDQYFNIIFEKDQQTYSKK